MKTCLIIGNKNAVQMQNVFPHIKDGDIRIGYTTPVFDGLEGLCRWYSTFPVDYTDQPLKARYSPEKYPAYETFDPIECGKLKDLPDDYQGNIGCLLHTC